MRFWWLPFAWVLFTAATLGAVYLFMKYCEDADRAEERDKGEV